MTVTLSGISSGLNTSAIVQELVTAESAPLTRMQTEQSNVDSAASTLQSFASTLTTLQNTASTLADPSQFASYTASSSGAAIVPAATNGVPVAGSYEVQVNALAQEQRTYSDPQSSSTAALGLTGSIGVSVAGKTATINVTAGESLTDIATAMNQANVGVNANVLFDGTNYRLQVRGANTGAANAISFTETGLSLGLTNPANTAQKAQDASVTLDGINYTRSTNSVVGVIPGVSLALTQTSSSPVTITVASDPSTLENKIQSFVTAYNAVITGGHTDAGYASTAAQNSLLQSDSGVRSTLDQLSSLVDSPITGASGTYSSLGDVGISIQGDGTLTFDTSQFENALSTDPTSVQSLFATTNGTGGVMSNFVSTINGLTGGTSTVIDAEVTAFQGRSTSLQSDEAQLQQQISDYQTKLQAQFTNVESMISKYKNLDATLLNAAFPGLGGSSSSSSSSSSNGGLSFGTLNTSG